MSSLLLLVWSSSSLQFTILTFCHPSTHGASMLYWGLWNIWSLLLDLSWSFSNIEGQPFINVFSAFPIKSLNSTFTVWLESVVGEKHRLSAPQLVINQIIAKNLYHLLGKSLWYSQFCGIWSCAWLRWHHESKEQLASKSVALRKSTLPAPCISIHCTDQCPMV